MNKITIHLKSGMLVELESARTGYSICDDDAPNCIRVWSNTETEDRTVIVPLLHVEKMELVNKK